MNGFEIMLEKLRAMDREEFFVFMEFLNNYCPEYVQRIIRDIE